MRSVTHIKARSLAQPPGPRHSYLQGLQESINWKANGSVASPGPLLQTLSLLFHHIRDSYSRYIPFVLDACQVRLWRRCHTALFRRWQRGENMRSLTFVNTLS